MPSCLLYIIAFVPAHILIMASDDVDQAACVIPAWHGTCGLVMSCATGYRNIGGSNAKCDRQLLPLNTV